MTSESDTGSGRGGNYTKIGSSTNYAEWKRKSEYLASQQGYNRFLIGKIPVASE